MIRPDRERRAQLARRATGCGGFTLVETLAVVALLALAMSVGVVQLSGATRRARVEAALHALSQADGAARSLAFAGTPISLRVGEGGQEVVVLDRRSGTPMSRRSLPSRVRASFGTLAGGSLVSLEFDAAGRCVDHLRVLTVEERAASVVRVSGTTGWSQAIGGVP